MPTKPAAWRGPLMVVGPDHSFNGPDLPQSWSDANRHKGFTAQLMALGADSFTREFASGLVNDQLYAKRNVTTKRRGGLK